MSTATLGRAVGKARAHGKPATVYDTDEPGWFILITTDGSQYRRRRDQIAWRKTSTQNGATP